MRVTANGQLMPCLGNTEAVDLRALVRQNPGAVNVWTELVLLNQHTATVHHETI